MKSVICTTMAIPAPVSSVEEEDDRGLEIDIVDVVEVFRCSSKFVDIVKW
jgi:hypothetical protein